MSRETIRLYEVGQVVPTNKAVRSIIKSLSLTPENEQLADDFIKSVVAARRSEDGCEELLRLCRGTAIDEVEVMQEDKLRKRMELIFEFAGDLKRTEVTEHHIMTRLQNIEES